MQENKDLSKLFFTLINNNYDLEHITICIEKINFIYINIICKFLNYDSHSEMEYKEDLPFSKVARLCDFDMSKLYGIHTDKIFWRNFVHTTVINYLKILELSLKIKISEDLGQLQ